MRTKLKSLFIIAIILSLNSCSTSKYNEKNEKNGDSIENAIKVNSVSEEYNIVRKLCQNCEIKGKALISKEDKNYDKIDVVKPNGEKASYYFDINSFFGKW